MRWIALTAWLAGALIAASGCSQQCFVSETDIKHYQALMPPTLESDPKASLPPPAVTAHTPATVLNPEQRVPWHISLHEALAHALEHGITGIQSVRQPGNIQDDLVTINQLGQIEFASDANRVLAMNPAIFGSAIEASESRFDARWVSTMGWQHVDQQVQGLGSFQNGDSAAFTTGVAKPLATGGVAGITFSTNYQMLAQPPAFFQIQNPSYLARLDFTFDHPLIQSFGTDINQLLTRVPGTTFGSNIDPATGAFLNAGSPGFGQGLGLGSGFGATGILIARLRFDQSRAEFERVVNYKLLNVEVAYWNLYGAYVNLYAAEQGLRQAYETWKVIKARAQAGVKGEGDVTINAQEPQTLGQYHEFRANRNTALGQVLEFERVLRRLMGLPPEDGRQLIPCDAPTLAPYYPDYKCALEESLTKRPELVAIRDELKARQMDLLVQKNFLKPDLRFRSRYGISGLGSRLDGDGEVFDQSTGQFRTNNAFRNLSSTHFNDWNLGLVLNVPIGFRYEHAAVRRARLGLAQTWYAVKNEEQRAEAFLAQAYRDVIQTYQEIQLRRAQRIAAARELKVRETIVEVGTVAPGPFLLDAQRRWATALSQEYQAITAYNNALATFQFAKGTIQNFNNILINEGPLPECAQVRAVEHERQRSHALVVRERANPVPHQPLAVDKGQFGLPELPHYAAPSLPALFEGATATRPGGQPVASAQPGVAAGQPETIPLERAPADLMVPQNNDLGLPLEPSLPRELPGTSGLSAAPLGAAGPALPDVPVVPRTTAAAMPSAGPALGGSTYGAPAYALPTTPAFGQEETLDPPPLR